MVTVFGLGFVGLTTALGFAHLGYKVYGIDVDEERKAVLRKGILPFVEPEMDTYLNKYINSSFFVTDDVNEAISNSEFVFYCVGTPYGEDGAADLSYLFSAINTTLDSISDHKHRVLVIKSTIPPTTTKERIVPFVNEISKPEQMISVANNPEFLREGHCWEDFINSDRIVVGVGDEDTEKKLCDLYRPMNVPFFATTWNTGEYIKYLSNTLLATLISYSNEMAQIADVFGDIDISKAFNILHMDRRWNKADMASYVYPGCGYGGYCLPKDTCALYAQASEKGYHPSILSDVIEINNNRSGYFAKKIVHGLKEAAVIGILGLAFKPNSDDVRDTPAARIICELKKMGFNKIICYDPVATEQFRKRYPDLSVAFCDNVEEVMKQADAVAIVTAWDEFKTIRFKDRDKVIDCRYCLDDWRTTHQIRQE